MVVSRLHKKLALLRMEMLMSPKQRSFDECYYPPILTARILASKVKSFKL